MPKNILVDPKEMRAPGYVKFQDIPINQYNKTIEEEKAIYTKEDFLRIYRDMYYIREFETMLTSVKVNGEYQGFKYTYAGPSHLYIGQEASAVGQAYHLDENDFVFGTHRGHGEYIAKSLSAIQKLSDADLMDIMKTSHEGDVLRVVEGKQKTNEIKELAIDWVLYGLAAEIFAKKNGFNYGLGGSMHAFCIPLGVYPNNAIVGGSAPIATGVALYKKVNQKNGIVVANAGDGAMARGSVWEAMNFASMDQFTRLWEEGFKGGLPILFNFMNNHYGMGGQTYGETMAYHHLARVGAGVSESQMHTERVDGYNPLAVIDAMKRKKELILNHQGPAMLDVVTYRLTGHSTSDVFSYRTPEETAMWAEIDPIITFKDKLIQNGIATEAEIEAVISDVKERMIKICKLAADDTVSPIMDLTAEPDQIERIMFSNQKVEKMDDREPDVLLPKEENPQLAKIAPKARYMFDENGKALSKMRTFNIRDALFESILDKFYVDPTLITYGEDERYWNGAFGVYRGLTEAIPYHRLFNSPIAETAIVGTATGYGMAGGRVIVELMYADFIGCAGDEIFNQMAKWQSMTAGQLKMPVTLRVSVGSKYGAQHSQDWTSLCAMIPGLKVVYPVTPYDAKGLMNSVLNGTDPVVFFESQKLYDMGEQFHKEGVPTDYYEVEIGEPDIKREGTDVTILSAGAALYTALEAAKRLQEKYNISAEVIDARSLVPFNYEKVLESVKKTGKIVLTSDACQRGSFLNDMAQNISEMAFDYLDAPPVVVGSRNWITPAIELESFFIPQADQIIDTIHEKLMPIAGHVSKTNCSEVEQLRRAKLGV